MRKKIASTSHINGNIFFFCFIHVIYVLWLESILIFFPFTTNESIEDCEVMLTFCRFENIRMHFYRFFFKCYICAFLLIKTKLLPLRTIQIIDNSASYLADRSGLANKSITYFMIFRMHSTYFPNV